MLLDPAAPEAERAEQIGARTSGAAARLQRPQRRQLRRAGPGHPEALVILEQRVRPDARETLDYFASQHVSVKVISGDNAVSVGAVAGSLGLSGGRWTPANCPPIPPPSPRRWRSTTLRPGAAGPEARNGARAAVRDHTVAMTRRQVNDVLALKDADIGVAMGSGSPPRGRWPQIVLLDNKFATLPYVVGEGRRVIGNIERVSNLFLTKTAYSVLLALLVGVAGLVSHWGHTEPLLYPFQPIHVTIAAWFTIGIPAFILSLAPNNERARTGFVRRVVSSALPSGAVIGLATFCCYVLAYPGSKGTLVQQTQASTAALITLLISALWVLAVVARPYQWWRVALVATSAVAYVVIFAVPLAGRSSCWTPPMWR